jgi:signal recognition particle receptor subunit beta
MATLYVYVAGPDGAGKTQFLRSLGPSANFWTDADGVEYRRLTVDETLEIMVIGQADSTRFDKLLEIAQRDLLGYLLIVDSTAPETWSMARIMLANCRGYALMPTLIVANKQDLPNAATPENVGGWIGMEAMVYVAPCQATNSISARHAFLQLLYAVNNEIERLDALIKQIEEMLRSENGGSPQAAGEAV